jgi:hypothetical protein
MGSEAVDFIRGLQRDFSRMEIFKENLRKVEWVIDTEKPTFKQAEKLKSDPEISEFLDYDTDWYTQFPFDPLECFEYVILFGLPIIPEHRGYSLGEYNVFISYVYVIDLDNNVFEIYRDGYSMGKFSFQSLVDSAGSDWTQKLIQQMIKSPTHFFLLLLHPQVSPNHTCLLFFSIPFQGTPLN